MIIGIIGGIGSGKSTVSGHLESEYGYEVIKTDDLAKELMKDGTMLSEKLREAFGNDIYTADGSLDKARYSAAIYKNEENRKLSDSIVHPAVWQAVKSRVEEIRKRCSLEGAGKEACAVVETALPSKHLTEICDEIWFIYAAPEIRICRLMQDRGYTREYAKSVIESQLSDNSFMTYADRMINNGGDLSETLMNTDLILAETGI